jgi:hypothetical protein
MVALAMLALSARVPLSGYTMAQGKDDSPTLRAVLRLEQEWGVANGSLAAAVIAAVLSLLAVAVAWRRLPWLGIGATLAATLALGLGATSFDRLNAESLRAAEPVDQSWVDSADLGSASFVQLPEGDRARAFQQLFWNRSIERLVLVNAPPIDAFRADRATIADDGRVLVAGEPLRGPMLVQDWGSHAIWRNVREIRREEGLRLLQPVGSPRLRLLAAGFYADGWMRRGGSILVWGEPATLRLRLRMPPETKETTLSLRAPGYERDVTLAAGEQSVVDIPVRPNGRAWVLDFDTEGPGYLGDHRIVSVRAEPPALLPPTAGASESPVAGE